MSEQIRIFVEGQVSRRDPGNPQRPITAFVEGHADELAARRSDVLKHFLARAERVGGWVRHREIIEVLKADGWPARNRVEVAYSLGNDLKRFDIVVQY